MNLTELRVARIRRGVKAQELADAIDRTVDSYIKRENGNVRVTLSDAFTITQVLQLSLEEFVVIFFDGDLPFSKDSEENYNFRQFPFPLKKARERIGYSEEEVAVKLGIPVSGYKDREKGRVPVTLVECAQLSKLFELSFDEFNDIFFRSALPFRKEDSLPYNHIIPQKVGEINVKTSNSSRV